MKIMRNCLEKATVVLEGPQRILKAFCLGPVNNPAENHYFNYDLSKIFLSADTIIEEDKNVILKSGEQYKVFYIDKTNEFDIGLDFSDYILEDHQRFFIFANIYCSNNKKTIFRFGKNCRMKVWLNHTLIFNGYPNNSEGNFVLTTLNEGNNLIFSEYLPTPQNQQGTVFSIRISECDNESTQTENEFMGFFLEQRVEAKIQTIYETCCIEDDSYKLSIIPMDFYNVDVFRPIKISICDSNKVELDLIQSEFYKVISLNALQSYDNVRDNNFLRLSILYYDKKGNEKIQNHYLVYMDSLHHLEEKTSFYESHLAGLALTPIQLICFTGLLNDYKRLILQLKNSITKNIPWMQTGTINQILFFREKLEMVIASYDFSQISNEHFDEAGKAFDIYYKSKLDESIQKYIVCTPENYSVENVYPIVIYLVPKVVSYGPGFSSQLPSELSEDVIIATISTRNVTLGSYMGEASIWEAIAEIKAAFSIDENRIYIVGYSNGAYACWGLIQSYPHLFAAAAPLSGGLYLKNIGNISSTPFYSIFSDKDHSHLRTLSGELQKWIVDQHNCTPYKMEIFKETDHWTLHPVVMHNKALLEWLLQHRRELYNSKSYFRTERICHNGNEWVQIITLEKGAKYCEFELEVISNSHIRLTLVNAIKFILKLPHYVNKTDLRITINNEDLFLSERSDNIELCFVKTGEKYCYEAKSNSAQHIGSSWGMGILNILMDSLKIIIPSSFSSTDEGDIITKVAQCISQPKSQGYDPNIDVKYPVLKDDISDAVIADSNLILIGGKDNNQFIEKMKHQLQIKMSESGFSYNGHWYNGDYCLMFIQPNPLTPSKKVFIICSNTLALLKKQFFLRKFVIPSYFNGFHPFLNCEAVIFDGKDYSVIDVLGNEITKV